MTYPVESGDRFPDRPSDAAVACARRLQRISRTRAAGLSPGIFGDPAWEIVLDLFVSRADGRRLSVSAVCVGVTASMATALRYVGLLDQDGLIFRTPDPSDGRRFYLDLTDEGIAFVERVLAAGSEF